jgi:hypothetical protein
VDTGLFGFEESTIGQDKTNLPRLSSAARWLSWCAPAARSASQYGPMVFHSVLVPVSTNTKEEPSPAHLVDRGDEFGGLDNVALLNQATPLPNLMVL